MSGISKGQVSRLCEEIDKRVKDFLDRPFEGDWPARRCLVWISAGPRPRPSGRAFLQEAGPARPARAEAGRL